MSLELEDAMRASRGSGTGKSGIHEDEVRWIFGGIL